VSDISALRRSLAEGGASFAVVKNTLMLRAATDAGVDELAQMLAGPSAVAFVAGDPVAAAKKVVDAAKLYPSLVLKGGYMDGKVLTAEDAKALASLESREVMLSKIAGLFKSEITRAAAMLVSAQSKFLGLLEAYKDKLPPAEAPSSTDAENGQSPEPVSAAEPLTTADEASTEPPANADEPDAAADATADEAPTTDVSPEAEEGKE
jgi:large subunit ribosomal protein L10